jgi:hypothetical protein
MVEYEMTDFPPMPGYPHGIITTGIDTQPRTGQYKITYNHYGITYNNDGVAYNDDVIRQE